MTLTKLQLWQKAHRHPCLDCGKLISVRATRCYHCNALYKWKTGILTKEHLSGGEKHPAWKGGRVKSYGYIYIRSPHHPRAVNHGYVLEHLLVWEAFHSKSLPLDWVIHHLNGIRDDNRPVNLVAMPQKRHNLLHQAMAKRIQELEALLNHQHQLL